MEKLCTSKTFLRMASGRMHHSMLCIYRFTTCKWIDSQFGFVKGSNYEDGGGINFLVFFCLPTLKYCVIGEYYTNVVFVFNVYLSCLYKLVFEGVLFVLAPQAFIVTMC